MPYCPSCGYEYQPGVSECPDCREKLVNLLKPDAHGAERTNIRFVPMPELPGRVFAEMVKGALEEQGIHSYIRSDGISEGFGIVGTGPIAKVFRLFVPENRYEESLDIQKQMMDQE
ncbi:MAG TPA: DUF2007 domain-containing protein [bacterium]